MRLIAQSDIDKVFGKITPPPGSEAFGGDPIVALGKLLGTGVRLFLIVAGLFLLIYLLWGAFDWITSSGEKERVEKAQGKITNAIIGILLIFVVLAVWGLITGDILGIIINSPSGWQLKIPTIK